MVLRRDRGLVQATRTRRKTPVQEAHDASRTNRHGTGLLTRSHDWKLGTWNCRSLKFDGSIRILSDILRVRKFSIVALQEVGWIGAEEVQEYRWIGCTIYQSRGEKKRLGTAFIVLGEMHDRVIGWTPLTDRMCVLRVKGRFFNISIINVHSPHSGSEDDDKDAFYEQLNWTYNSCPKHDIKIVIGDFNAQVGQEEEFRPVIGKFSAHVRTNENGLRLIDFATSKNMAVRSTCFQHNLRDKYTWRSPQGSESQIDHVVIDGRHFSDIIDVRTYRGANVDSDHYLVMVKMRQRLSLAKSVRYRRPPRLDLERLKLPEVASRYAHSLEAALPGEGELLEAPLEDCWRNVKAAITNAAESTIGFVERGRRNDWFDEECRAILEEKNAARRAMLQYNLRDYEEAYGQKRRQQHQLFRAKVRHQEELEFEDMEQLHRSNETRKFYKKLNGSRNGFTPRVEMCRDKNGAILTNEREKQRQGSKAAGERTSSVQQEKERSQFPR
ncbi:craniofacial development protein 2-like [Culex quinquefasciatus]|uniref:craniofacial development protein 2-like n=1 Tax=Culex quinquefasciatus TaxID=7176 RepID=UPI0018E3B715|nr:craniofacial development protein 2-like [Culex quinquefasciatus]